MTALEDVKVGDWYFLGEHKKPKDEDEPNRENPFFYFYPSKNDPFLKCILLVEGYNVPYALGTIFRYESGMVKFTTEIVDLLNYNLRRLKKNDPMVKKVLKDQEEYKKVLDQQIKMARDIADVYKMMGSITPSEPTYRRGYKTQFDDWGPSSGEDDL